MHNRMWAVNQFEVYQNKKARIIKNNEQIKGINFRKIIRPLLLFALKIQRMFIKMQIQIISEADVKRDAPIIYAVSHIGKWDFEIVYEVLKNFFYVVASDYVNNYGSIGGIFFWSTGCIWVNEYSKMDRKNSKEMMLKILKQKGNILIFPEGTWNLTENEIIKDTSFGTIDCALETGAVIVPIALEQYDKRFVINIGKELLLDDICKKYTEKRFEELDATEGKDINIRKKIELDANKLLRDTLATLKWEIWEREGIERRKNIPFNYWNDFISIRFSEWPGYKMEEQVVNSCFPPEKKEWIRVQQTMAKLNSNWWKSCWICDDV